MINKSAPLGRNTAFMIGSHLIISLAGTVTTMFVLRAISPDQYGDLMLALAYVGFFTTLAESSLGMTILREASRTPSRLRHLLGNGLLLQGGLALCAFGLALIILPLAGYDAATNQLLKISLGLLLLSPLGLFRFVFLVVQEIKLLAILDIIIRLLGFVVTLLIVWIGMVSAHALLFIQIGTAVAAAGIYFIYGWRSLSKGSFHPDWQLCGNFIKGSWPLVLTSLMLAAQANLGRLLIGRYLDKTDLGFYTMGIKLASTVHFLPAVYFTIVYPLLAHHFVNDRIKFRQLYQRSYKYLMIAILPIALLASLTSNEIVSLYAGEQYLPAAALFSWLIGLQIFAFAGMTQYYTMLAANQQNYFPKISLLRISVQFTLLVFLLPIIGLLGTVIAALFMYVIVYGAYLVIEETRQYVLDWLSALVTPFFALMITGGILISLNLPFITIWLLGLVLYGGLLLIAEFLQQQARILINNPQVFQPHKLPES